MKNSFQPQLPTLAKFPWSSVIGHRSLISKRTQMNVLCVNSGSTGNSFPFLNCFAFVFVFLFANLFYIQESKAQLFNPYSGYTCDVQEGYPWRNDSLVLPFPAPNQACLYKFYFKVRFKNCTDSLHLEVQPVGVLLDYSLGTCSNSIKNFYSDTNASHRIESLLRLADRTMVFNHNTMMTLPWRVGDTNLYKGYYVYDTVSLTPLIIDSTLTSDSVLRTSFIRPACRGICISYNRPDSLSAMTSVYAKWYNCGNACCEIISSFCNISSLTNVPPEYLNDGRSARIDFEVNYSGDCGTTPDSVCTIISLNTQVTRFKDCRNYCEDPEGLDPYGLQNFDKTQSGVYKLNENPYITDQFLRSIQENILLETTTNEIIIYFSEEVQTIKIVSISGVELQNQKISSGQMSHQLSFSTLQNGLYLLVIESKNNIITKPIIIAK